MGQNLIWMNWKRECVPTCALRTGGLGPLLQFFVGRLGILRVSSFRHCCVSNAKSKKLLSFEICGFSEDERRGWFVSSLSSTTTATHHWTSKPCIDDRLDGTSSRYIIGTRFDHYNLDRPDLDKRLKICHNMIKTNNWTHSRKFYSSTLVMFKFRYMSIFIFE